MKFDIIEVFTRAAKITWKYKALWIFGILASCGRSSGNFNSSSRNRLTGNQASNEMIRQLTMLIRSVGNWLAKNPWVIVTFIVVFLILWLAQIFLSTIGQIGLVRGAYHAEMGAEKIKVGELFSESILYFWRVIGIGLIVFLPIIILFVGMFFAIIFIVEKTPNSINSGFGIFSLAIGVCCCFIPFMIVMGIYYTQALRALILEDLGVFASLSRGWEVFRKNIGGLLVVSLILFFVNLIIGIAIAIPIFIAILPVMTGFIRGNIHSWQPFILTGAFVLLYSPIAWFLSGVLLTYVETIWTLIYMRVTRQEGNTPVIIEANA